MDGDQIEQNMDQVCRICIFEKNIVFDSTYKVKIRAGGNKEILSITQLTYSNNHIFICLQLKSIIKT